MRVSEQWLREWVNPPLHTQGIADQLTLAGLEVDAIDTVAPPLDHVVVGEVLALEKHPNADKLRVAQVKIGTGTPVQIVCGAANVAVGQKVPAALPGAVLPGDKKIGKAALRGVESNGMLCSGVELGIAESADGLLVLPGDAPVGAAISDYLKLNDRVYEFGITPNRGDCLSVQGIAREVAALNNMSLTMPSASPVAPRSDQTFPVVVQAPEACPRYLGRVISGIRRDAQTPIWLQERLRRGGVRSLHPVVDVTNYLLLEHGQPMHAFDLNKLQRAITVRFARQGEVLKSLDGQTLTLAANTLVIADDNGPVALAGVMGGADSAVTGSTEDLFLESAFFAPSSIAGRARQYGLQTESSRRFERGVDAELARRAMERATQLILDIVGGVAGPINETMSAAHLPKREPILLRSERIRRLLGWEFTAQEVTSLLRRLGMTVVAEGAGSWKITPPTYRFDIAIEADLIEELARLYGYGQLPQAAPQASLRVADRRGGNVDDAIVRQTLVTRGYHEAITYSFIDPAAHRRIVPDVKAVRLQNPIAANMAEMRTTLWPGLIEVARYNLNRQVQRIRLFEVGNLYFPVDGGSREEKVVAGLITGPAYPEQWGMPQRPADFFDLKSDVESILALTGAGRDFIFKPESDPALHPGQSAAIYDRENRRVGRAGVLHPELQRELDFPQSVAVFELQLGLALPLRQPKFAELSKFPLIRRDLALVVDETVIASALGQAIREVAGERLKELQLFDLYRGEGIDSGKKSLALRLTLQDTLKTLQDDEIETIISQVLTQLVRQFGATLRD